MVGVERERSTDGDLKTCNSTVPIIFLMRVPPGAKSLTRVRPPHSFYQLSRLEALSPISQGTMNQKTNQTKTNQSSVLCSPLLSN